MESQLAGVSAGVSVSNSVAANDTVVGFHLNFLMEAVGRARGNF